MSYEFESGANLRKQFYTDEQNHENNNILNISFPFFLYQNKNLKFSVKKDHSKTNKQT